MLHQPTQHIFLFLAMKLCLSAPIKCQLLKSPDSQLKSQSVRIFLHRSIKLDFLHYFCDCAIFEPSWNFESGIWLCSVESASWKQCAGEIKQRENLRPSRRNFLGVFTIFMKRGALRWVQDRCCRNKSLRCRLHAVDDPGRRWARSRSRHRATPRSDSSKMCLNALWINIKLFSFFLHVFFVLLVERRRKNLVEVSWKESFAQ